MTNRYFLVLDNGDGATVSLDSVSRLSETFSGQVTQNPVANGDSVGDHYLTNNAKFSIEGVLTGTTAVQGGEIRYTPDITEQHRNLIKKGAILSFISGDTIYNNCFVNEVSFTKTSREGILGWQVRLSLEQVQLARGGSTTLVNVIPDQSAARTDINASSTKAGNGVIQSEGLATNVIPDRTIYDFVLEE